ncbi:MAG TPA: biotin attachment protein [Rubrivivax sp.]|nr:biotin attachment protein [Rubrivivax sp.]
MMIDIKLQDEAWTDVEEGTEALLDEWLVKPGDTVAAGQSVAVVVVAKTTFEVPAPTAGVVRALLLKPQDPVARDQVLAEMEAAG